MCSVIGYQPGSVISSDVASGVFARLMMEGRARGMHAYGLAHRLRVMRSTDVREVIRAFNPEQAVIAHCRYSTSGDWQDMSNNQPIVVGANALVFNGVIHMGTREEMEREFGVTLSTYNDGEVFLRLMERAQNEMTVHSTELIHLAVPEMIVKSLAGSFAGLVLQPFGRIIAIRNERRPLWRAEAGGATWFASTQDILHRAGVPPPYVDVPPGVAMTAGGPA